MVIEKQIEILEELRQDLNNKCSNSDTYYTIEALDAAIDRIKCDSKNPIGFSMQDVEDSDEKIWVTDVDFKAIFAGVLYYMVPKQPRKFDIIMTKLIEIIDRTFTESVGSVNMISVAYKDVYNWIETVVKSIPEILELNLTTNEFNAGVTLENREGADIVFTSAFSVTPEGEDFVDIDALIQNVTYHICKQAAEL